MAKQKQPKTEKKDLQEAIDEIKQRFGEGAIMKLKEVRAVDIDVISTGSISLDLALGVRGIPRGRVIEIFGNAVKQAKVDDKERINAIKRLRDFTARK